MRLPPSFLDEIRERVPISSLVGTRVTFDLKKSNAARGDFWACCPFHREKTPSFHCDDGRGRYHCFGCGASGDVFRFLTELEGISFYEAVEQLASLAGLAVPKQDEATKNQEDERGRLHEILEKAALFFERGLRQGDARLAHDYLKNRGLGEAMIRHFRLGFAADHRSCLREYLSQQGYGLDLMEQAGLIISGEDVPVPYDRFRHRIMFPIANLKGRIVGFGGRALATNARAKYLNSPETEIFHKGNLLYNLGGARQALRIREPDKHDPETDTVKSLIVVEGYMDVIALASAGIAQAVAPLGTAMTHEQLQLLWRFSPSPIICFDGDEAGFNAALRVLDRALGVLKTGLSLQFVLLPKMKDPDDIVRDGGAQAFISLLRQALPLAEMLWRRATLGKKFDTPESRATLEKTLMQAVFTITDENLRRYYLQDMRTRLRNLFAAPRYGTYNKSFNNRAKDLPRQPMSGRYQRGQGHSAIGMESGLATSRMVHSGGFSSREAAILAMLIYHPALWETNFDMLTRLEFGNARLRQLHQSMLEILAEWQPQDGVAMRKLLIQQGQEQVVTEIDVLMQGLGLHKIMVEASFEDVGTILKQALHLHMRARTLHKQLREIEMEVMANPQAQHFSMLADVKAELEATDATQALIEGFGDWT